VSKPVTLQSLPSSGLEGEERFQLRLVGASNGAVVSATHGSATVVVQSDPRLSGTIAVAPSSRTVLIGRNASGRVQLVRNGGKYGRVDVTWQILTRPDSDVFRQTEGIATFHDLETTGSIRVMVITCRTGWSEDDWLPCYCIFNVDLIGEVSLFLLSFKSCSFTVGMWDTI